MGRRSRRWLLLFGGLAAVGVVALVATSAPYLPVVHGTTEDEIERLAARLDVGSGSHVADLGAGRGGFAIALARRVGPDGQVHATEIDPRRLEQIRRAASEAGLANVTVVEGAVSETNLPEACCDAVFSRAVYHHLSDRAAINADLFRAIRPGGRLLVIDFEPGGLLDLIAPRDGPDGGHGTRKETVVEEVTAAGFRLERGPEAWRGRMYAILFIRPAD